MRTQGAPTGVDLVAIAHTGAKLRALKDQLAAIFPEREGLLTQILYALITREHVLIQGEFGTGKSDLVQTLFSVFQGSDLFSVALTRFMTETSVIGLPNTLIMQQRGVVQYERTGGILDAHFAELDELLDASGPLLRVLLGVLNERIFKRGHQREVANLHTAIASTNVDPVEAVRRDPSLGAVIDRFLFNAKVGYLTDPASRRGMFAKFLAGASPDIRIEYSELLALSSIVVDANQITDPDMISLLVEVIDAYRKEMGKKVVISDRRACKVLQLVEGNALLYGRYEVVPEDVLAMRWGLCTVGDDAQFEAFDKVAKPLVDAATAARSQGIDDVQRSLLGQYQQQLPQIPTDATSDQLVTIARELTMLRSQVDAVLPQLASTADTKKNLLADITKLAEAVDTLIKKG